MSLKVSRAVPVFVRIQSEIQIFNVSFLLLLSRNILHRIKSFQYINKIEQPAAAASSTL